MMVPATSTHIPTLPPMVSTQTSSAPAPNGSFQDLLLQSLHQTAGLEASAQAQIAESLGGGDVTQVESIVALREADLALRLMVQIRNKLLDAYNEIRQMQF